MFAPWRSKYAGSTERIDSVVAMQGHKGRAALLLLSDGSQHKTKMGKESDALGRAGSCQTEQTLAGG